MGKNRSQQFFRTCFIFYDTLNTSSRDLYAELLVLLTVVIFFMEKLYGGWTKGNSNEMTLTLTLGLFYKERSIGENVFPAYRRPVISLPASTILFFVHHHHYVLCR
jgi:hypothetical protein